MLAKEAAGSSMAEPITSVYFVSATDRDTTVGVMPATWLHYSTTVCPVRTFVLMILGKRWEPCSGLDVGRDAVELNLILKLNLSSFHLHVIVLGDFVTSTVNCLFLGFTCFARDGRENNARPATLILHLSSSQSCLFDRCVVTCEAIL